MSFGNEEKPYEMLGRYVVAFEDFCNSIQGRIIDVLHTQNLKNENVHEILLEGLTAAPLLSKLRALVNSVVAKDEEERKIFSMVFNQFNKIIDERNIYLHSHWFTFAESVESENTLYIQGSKLGLNGSGAASKVSNLKLEDFEHSIQRCREACLQLGLVMRITLGYRTLGECFELKSNTLTVNYEALKPISSSNV